MAKIIYTAKLSGDTVVNFTNLYNENKELLDEADYITNSQGIEFVPLVLQVNDGVHFSNNQEIYLHIRNKDKKHYMITSDEYESIAGVLEDKDIVIFINDNEEAENEFEELRKYLERKYKVEI